MAYAFLKGLGLDGNIGEIQIDITRNKESSKATDGHLVNGHAGEVGKRVTLEIRSTRWPFCFQGDGKTSGSTRSIVPFVPFNQDLNRLTLKVTGLETAKGKVTWGGESKEFTKDQLAAGVNLAAEFSRTPFDEAFSKLQAAVANKQGFETQMIKQLITNFRVVANLAKDDADIANATAALNKALHAHQARLDKAAREQLQPVKHTLVVEAVN
jgi:hypothetical protein